MSNQDKKSFLDNLSHEKPESFNDEVFIKQKKNYVPTIIMAITILIVASIIFTMTSKGSVVPEMNGWTEGEVANWAKSNHATIIKTESNSLSVTTGIVMNQSYPAGYKLKRNGNLSVTFSTGPNPNEEIEFPDIKSLTLTEINTWIDKNKLSGVSIKKENSSVFDKDKVINYEFVDGNEQSFLRKNRIKIYVSLGSKDLQDTISVPEFIGFKKGDLVKWAEKNKIKVQFEEEFNEYVDYGNVAAQSISGNTKMKRDDSLTITLSLGEPILVPDFIGITKTEANELAAFKGLQVHFTNQISSKDEGIILAQDIEEGSTIHSKQLVTITVATESDNVTVPNFIGLNSSEASTLASIQNVKTFFVEKSSIEKKDTVVEQSKKPDSIINAEILVTVYISSGDITVPNFIGLTKEDAEYVGQDKDINLIFKTVISDSTTKDTVLTQSVDVDQIIEKDARITLTIADNNGAIIPDFSSMTKKEVESWGVLHDTQIAIIEQYHNTIAISSMFDQNFINTYLPSNETLIVHQSMGKVPVTDFTNQTKLDIITWQKNVNSDGGYIDLNILDASNTSKPTGTIVNQSVKSDVVQTHSTIDVWVATSSMANEVPNMTSVDEFSFTTWCEQNNTTYLVVDQYSDTYEVGTLFGQNYISQSVPEGESLRIYRSIGKLTIESFIGKEKTAIEAWLNNANLKGANITLTYSQSASNIYRTDHIVNQSHIKNNVAIGSTINITLATVKDKSIPSIIGKSASDAIRLLDQLGIKYTIIYEYIPKDSTLNYPANSVMNQSKSATEIMTAEDRLIVTVSKGKAK